MEMTTAIDIALAKGGREAVVESYYSVMSSHATGSKLSNEMLSFCTITDWCYPSQSACTNWYQHTPGHSPTTLKW